VESLALQEAIPPKNGKSRKKIVKVIIR